MHLVLLLYALFASGFIIAKTTLSYGQPLFLIGSRMMFAGLLLLGAEWMKNRTSFSLKNLPWKRLIALGIINIYLTNAFEFYGLQHLTSFKTCFLYSFSPFLSALFSYFLFSERMTSKKWLGLTIGFIGFIPILLSQTELEEATGQLFFFSWGELSVIAACICSVYGWILLKQAVSKDSVSPLLANSISMIVGGVFALCHSRLVEPWNPIPVTEPIPFLQGAILLTIVSNLIAYNLYGYLLKKLSATFISFAGFSTPLFTALLGWYFLGESVGLPFFVSSAVVFMGLFLFYQEELLAEPRLTTT